ncbi:MAG: hypothetical protein ACLQOO_20320 [Terriglobia bacterium]
MKGPAPRRLRQYMARCLGLAAYLLAPADGRVQPQIPASALLWALLIGQILRKSAFHAIESLVRSTTRALEVSRAFSDDALGYFTERLRPTLTRQALADCVRRAKRNKAFDGSRFIGLDSLGFISAPAGRHVVAVAKEAGFPLLKSRSTSRRMPLSADWGSHLRIDFIRVP